MIAISSSGQSLDAEVDPRFGRCQYFIIADPDTLEHQAISNDGLNASGGAGIAAAQQLAARKVTAVLTGHCGPNAFDTLKAAGIEVLTDVSGTVREAIAGYQAGKYQAAAQATVRAHHGMG